MRDSLSKHQTESAAWLRYLAIGTLSLLSACSGGDSTTTLDPAPPLVFGFPDTLADADFLDLDNLRPVVSLSNGAVITMIRQGEQRWSGLVNVPAGAVYKVTVTWVERFMDQDLPLTSRTFDLAVGNDGSAVQSNSTGYNVEFDSDNDGPTNLAERRAGSNPLVPNAAQPDSQPEPADTPANEGPDSPSEPDSDAPVTDLNPTLPVIADVMVPRISEANAPVIDGLGVTLGADNKFSGEWARAVQSDTSGTTLLIDQLMIDINAEDTNSLPYRRWAAMHDGRYLYVVVIVDDNGQRYRDSGASLNDDDSLELFLDADNSKSVRYGDNDYHRIFPLREAGARASKSGVSTGEAVGPNSSRKPLIVNFATGPGIGPDGLRRWNYEQDVYELRLDLESAGISTDAPFGFELQVNDDDDGMGRDSKWGWKHPNRINSDVDNTIVDPSFMGTLKLE
ncbi:MAG: sugar-binding protein [Granulosicoccus sp.]